MVTFAGVAPSTGGGRPISVSEMTEKDFMNHKRALKKDLRELVDDFSRWPKTDQSKICITRDTVTVLPGLERRRQHKYDGNLAFWIEVNSPLLGDHAMRVSLVRCLGYLQQKK